MEQLQTQSSRTADRSSIWFAWAVLFLGGLLAVSAIWLTLTNLDRTVILNVLLPGTAIGTLLMVLGALGIRTCEMLYAKGSVDLRETELLTYVFVGGALAAGVGTALGVWLGAVALGVTVGPLAGVALGFAVWIRANRVDA